jgi:C4-dicarboxylate-specific signal transduction histidine kinase
MATRTIRFMSAAVRAARRAKQWALVTAREADRLLHAARKQAESEDRRRQLKHTLRKTGRVLMVAGRAALVAAVAAGITQARAEHRGRRLPQGRER